MKLTLVARRRVHAGDAASSIARRGYRIFHRFPHRSAGRSVFCRAAANGSTGTTSSRLRSRRARSARWYGKDQLIAISGEDAACWRWTTAGRHCSSLGAAVRRLWGKPLIARYRIGGQDHDQGNHRPRPGDSTRVLKSQGNLNNQFGLPLQLLKLEPEHEIAVIEMGMSHAGEITELAQPRATQLWRGDIGRAGASGVFRFDRCHRARQV